MKDNGGQNGKVLRIIGWKEHKPFHAFFQQVLPIDEKRTFKNGINETKAKMLLTKINTRLSFTLGAEWMDP